MVTSSRWLGGSAQQGDGLATSRPEFSGCITSRPEPSVLTHAKIGRIKCIAGKPDGEVELIHYSNHERTETLCGKPVIEKRPYMGNVAWGSAGNDWCKRCEYVILSQMK